MVLAVLLITRKRENEIRERVKLLSGIQCT